MNNNKIEYRLFKSNDIIDLSILYVDSWLKTYNKLIPNEYLNTLNYDMAQDKFNKFIIEEKDSFIYVAIDIDTQVLCGFAVCKRDDDEIESGLLYSLHVKSEYKGIGIGKHLIKQCAKHFRDQIGLNSLLLWVVDGNDNAYNVYTKLGAQVLKYQNTIYSNNINTPETCLIWNDINKIIN